MQAVADQFIINLVVEQTGAQTCLLYTSFNFRFCLDDIRGNPAGIGVGVMDTLFGVHVFAQIIDADTHQFGGVQRAAARFRIACGMTGNACLLYTSGLTEIVRASLKALPISLD